MPIPKGRVIELKIFLSSILRTYIPGYDPDKGYETDVLQETTVSDLCKKINVPSDMVAIVMVDGKIEGLDYMLNGAERVYLFPAIGGG